MLENYSDDQIQEFATQLLIEAILEGRIPVSDTELSHVHEIGLELGLKETVDFVDGFKRAGRILRNSAPRAKRLKTARNFISSRRKDALNAKFVSGAKKAYETASKIPLKKVAMYTAVGAGALYGGTKLKQYVRLGKKKSE
jgi:hypothetical protein